MQIFYYLCNECGKAIQADSIKDIKKRKSGLCVKCRYKPENIWNWKGDNVSYRVLHKYIIRHKPKSEKCEKCGSKGKLEIANIDGKYSRKIKDYLWLCKSCHRTMDYDETKRKRDEKGRYTTKGEL